MSTKGQNIDKILIRRLKGGDQKAFDEIFSIYYNDIFAYSMSILKSKDLAEEIVQEVFIKVWLYREKLDPTLSFKSFIFTITRNLTFNLITKISNRKKLKENLLYQLQIVHNPIENELADKHYDTLKKKALDQLPPKRKVIFLMSRNEGKSYDEISKELNISVNTVKAQISKALATLRSYLETYSDITLLFVIYLFG